MSNARSAPFDRRTVLGGGLALAAGCPALAKERPLTLTRALPGGELTLSGAPKFAGAVSSLKYRGMEYVDAADHGRLFQTAIHFDGLGECLNPTQGGSSSDKRRSTSRLLHALTTADVYAVSTRMAYWLRPGQICTLPERGRVQTANITRRSEVTVDVAHGFGGLPAPAAASSLIRFTSPNLHETAVVEALTIYTPAVFNTFHRYEAGAFTRAEAAAEQPAPYALATGDGAHAVALFSPRGLEPARFGAFTYGGVGKLNAVFRPAGRFIPGAHTFRLAWTVGTLDEVAATIAACV